MTTTPFERQQTGDSLIPVAAWSMIAGALLQMIGGFVFGRLEAQDQPPGPVLALNVVSHLLLLVGVIGLARSGVAGRGRLAGIGLALTMLGLVVISAGEMAVALESSADLLLFGVGSAAMALGLIMAGVAVLRTRRWTGWQRFIPLATGLFLLPVGPLPSIAFSIAMGAWGILWLLLGLSLRSGANS